MKYTTIEIPTILIMFAMGMCGFFGLGSFVGGITGNDTYGYIAGCFGFVFMIFISRHMKKTINKQEENNVEVNKGGQQRNE